MVSEIAGKKIDEELARQQIEFSRVLFEMNSGIAKKVIVVANLEIERLQKLQKIADEDFASAVKFMEEKEFDRAASEFRKTKEIRDDIGDENGAMFAEAFLSESLSRMWFEDDYFSSATGFAKNALESFKKISDQEGVTRIEALIKEIEQKENKGKK